MLELLPSAECRPSFRSARRFRPSILLCVACLGAVLARDAVAVPPPVAGGPLPDSVARAVTSGLTSVTPPVSNLQAPAVEPTRGTWNVPVLLVDFPDRRATYPASGFASLLFDTTGANPTGSLATYYQEVSAGAVRVRGEVFGWATLPDTANFYAN